MNVPAYKRLGRVLAAGMVLLTLGGCAAQGGGEAVSQPDVPSQSVTQPPAQPSVTTYPFMAGTVEENVITVIDSGVDGPTVFIAAGIHGDEVAAWMAGDKLEEELQIARGKVYILSPVNLSGSLAETRFVGNSGDMNRVFPGDANSTDMATLIAAALFHEIETIQPDLVLDLHEARVDLGGGSTGGGLANTLIFTHEEKLSEMMFDFTLANEAGQVLDRKFGLTSPGVTGSFNRVVSDRLDVPVITTETWRKLEIPNRIDQQIEIVNFCLNYLGMMDSITE